MSKVSAAGFIGGGNGIARPFAMRAARSSSMLRTLDNTRVRTCSSCTFESSNTMARCDMRLLDRLLRPIEEARLRVVIGELCGAGAKLGLRIALQLDRPDRNETRCGAFTRPGVLAGFGETVRFVGGAALEDLRLHHPSRCRFWNGHLGAFTGIWWKLLVPRRDFCVSR